MHSAHNKLSVRSHDSVGSDRSVRTIGQSSNSSTITADRAPTVNIELESMKYADVGKLTMKQSVVYRTYPQAWLCLAVLFGLRVSTPLLMTTYSPIPTLIAEYMAVSLDAVNWLSNIASITYVLMSFITAWIFDTAGMKDTLIIAGLLGAVGGWIRWIATAFPNPLKYPVSAVGQTVASLAAPLTVNIGAKFASTWFTEDKRATAGMVVACNYGGFLAQLIIPNIAKTAGQVPLTLIVVAVISSVTLLPTFFIPAKPPTPPSAVSQSDNRLPYIQSMLHLVKNYHFWILFFIQSINAGLSGAFGTLLNEILTPYGYSNEHVGLIGALGVVAGCLGVSAAGPMIDKTKQHKMLFRLFAPMMALTFVALVFVVSQNSFPAILFLVCMNQFFVAFLVPVALELTVEVTFPLSESIGCSALWQGTNLFTIVLVILMGALRNPQGIPPNNMCRALIFQAILASVCAVLACVYNGPMKRQQWIQEQKEAQMRGEGTQTDDSFSSWTKSGVNRSLFSDLEGGKRWVSPRTMRTIRTV